VPVPRPAAFEPDDVHLPVAGAVTARVAFRLGERPQSANERDQD